jgi:hypothetical protein
MRLIYTPVLLLFSVAASAQLPPALPPLPSSVPTGTANVAAKSNAVFQLDDVFGARHSTTIFGDVTKLELKSKAPSILLDKYKSTLKSAGWSIVVAPSKKNALLTARKYAKYREAWVELKSEEGGVALTFVDSNFPGDSLHFGEADTMEMKARKFKGLFELPAPQESALKTDDWEDFPYLRHLPGFTLRDDLTRHSDSLHLERLQLTPTKVIDELVLQGPTTTKTYQAAFGVSTYKALIAYRLALMNSGWTIVDSDVGYVGDKPWLVARYDLSDRTLWARLQFTGFSAKFTVAEVLK